jgi:hypothetical protein
VNLADNIPGNSTALSYPNATAAEVVYTNAPTFDPNSTHFSSLPATTSMGDDIMYDNVNHVTGVDYNAYFLHQTSSALTNTNPFTSYLLYVKSML